MLSRFIFLSSKETCKIFFPVKQDKCKHNLRLRCPWISHFIALYPIKIDDSYFTSVLGECTEWKKAPTSSDNRAIKWCSWQNCRYHEMIWTGHTCPDQSLPFFIMGSMPKTTQQALLNTKHSLLCLYVYSLHSNSLFAWRNHNIHATK